MRHIAWLIPLAAIAAVFAAVSQPATGQTATTSATATPATTAEPPTPATTATPATTGPGIGMSQEELTRMAPARGWLESHRNVRQPLGLLGGPLRVAVKQPSGGVHVALPDYRGLDPAVFGTPSLPLAWGGSPIMTGVPPSMRGARGDRYTTMTALSPFGDRHVVWDEGRLDMDALDATATDGATTKDTVRLEASWRDLQGNTYTVRCSEVIPAGVDYPVFGGVSTNSLMHGMSGVGSPLMPTEFAYVAFTGIGETLKNGEVTDKPVIVHGMLTEFVRTEDYRLAFDSEVTPQRLHFHVLVPPVLVENGRFVPHNVKTGYMMSDGQEMPFWHVMFDNLDIQAQRTEERAGIANATTTAREIRGRGDMSSTASDMTGAAGAAGAGMGGSTDSGMGATTATTAVAGARARMVRMTDASKYIPARLRVRVGDTVTWQNSSRLTHTVTADPSKAANAEHARIPQGVQPFDSGNIAPGGTYSYTFSVPGEYRYFCIPHGALGMIGTVTVVERGQSLGEDENEDVSRVPRRPGL